MPQKMNFFSEKIWYYRCKVLCNIMSRQHTRKHHTNTNANRGHDSVREIRPSNQSDTRKFKNCTKCQISFVQRWDDNYCPTCWAADDLVQKGKRDPVIREILDLISNFRREHLYIIWLGPLDLDVKPEPTRLSLEDREPFKPNLSVVDQLYSDLIGDLYMFVDPDREWEEQIVMMRSYISGVKAFPVPLLERLWDRIPTQDRIQP